jgi:hypothetical protein
MAQPHFSTDEESWGSLDGAYHHIMKCACGELFEGEGRSATEAKTQAQTEFGIHLHE